MKKNSGRPKKEVKRDLTCGIRFSKTEVFVVREKAAKAGMTFTSYIRDVAINGKVQSRFTNEERKLLKQLVVMSNNINQLVEIARKDGLLQAIFHFETYRNKIDELLNQIEHDQ